MADDYITLAELKEHLKVEVMTFDAKLVNVITSVSRWIDNHCERHFYQDGTAGSEVARVFDSADSRLLKLGVFNDLVSVTEVATDDDRDGTFETVWAASDYQPLPLNPDAAPETTPFREIRSTGTRTFPQVLRTSPVGLIRITGVWGWPAVPETVREACLMQAARIFKRREAPEGVLGFDQFGTVRVSGRPDPDVQANLAAYVHPQAALVA